METFFAMFPISLHMRWKSAEGMTVSTRSSGVSGLSSNVILRQTASVDFLVLNYAVANLGYLDFYLASDVDPDET